MNKKVIGITGGIGSGKSTVCKIIEEMDYPVFYADFEAKKILNSNEVLQIISTTFGDNIIVNNKVDRKKLASIVFSDKEELNKLNAIIHPRVKEAFRIWVKKQTSTICFKEAAIMIETKDKTVDFICSVITDKEERINRVIKRDSSNKQDILNRINNQITDKERISKSDFIIYNNKYDLLIPQVNQLLHIVQNKSRY